MQDVHRTSTGNFTYKQYVFIPADVAETRFIFCGKKYNSIEAVKAEIDKIIARKQ